MEKIKKRCSCRCKLSNDVLNMLTLHIKDPEIKEEYDKQRSIQFNQLWPLVFIATSYYGVLRIIDPDSWSDIQRVFHRVNE